MLFGHFSSRLFFLYFSPSLGDGPIYTQLSSQIALNPQKPYNQIQSLVVCKHQFIASTMFTLVSDQIRVGVQIVI